MNQTKYLKGIDVTQSDSLYQQGQQVWLQRFSIVYFVWDGLETYGADGADWTVNPLTCTWTNEDPIKDTYKIGSLFFKFKITGNDSEVQFMSNRLFSSSLGVRFRMRTLAKDGDPNPPPDYPIEWINATQDLQIVQNELPSKFGDSNKAVVKTFVFTCTNTPMAVRLHERLEITLEGDYTTYGGGDNLTWSDFSCSARGYLQIPDPPKPPPPPPPSPPPPPPPPPP